MAHTQSQQAYGQATGTTSTNFNWIDTRDPSNTSDTNYPIGTFWQNTSVPKLWYLNSKSMVGGVLTATWELISVASVLVSLSDNANTVVLPSLPSATPPDNIQLVAGTGISIVATPASNLITITNTGAGSEFTLDAGTTPVSGSDITLTSTMILNAGSLANALQTNGTGATTIAYQTQYAGENAGSSTGSNWGVSQFDSNSFAVSSGFVKLKNGGTTGAVTKMGTDDAGVTLPSAAGSIGIVGTAVENGMFAKPLWTSANASNIIGLNLQTATTSTSGEKNINNSGICHFDSTAFTADIATGFIALANGGTTGAVTNLIGDDSQSIIPSSGAITLLGTTVENGINTKPVYFKKNATSTEELDVQLATTSTSGAKNINKSGLCHFDSTDFTIDSSTGFVQLTGGATSAIQTITGNDSVAISGSGTPVNVNIIGSGSIITSGSGSTETIALTNLTIYNILAGAGTSTIAKIAPSATSGVPLISQGSASYPIFGTAVVAGGGTGNTTFTAYSVICAGTTLTGAFQNVSGVGTVGQVLTSNGASALPTWGTIPSSGTVWQVIVASQGLTANNGYFCISPGGALSLSLPTAGATIGTVIEVVLDGATSWTITQAAGQQIRFGNQQTTAGVSGSLASNKPGDSIRMICETANDRWVVVSSVGVLTVT